MMIKEPFYELEVKTRNCNIEILINDLPAEACKTGVSSIFSTPERFTLTLKADGFVLLSSMLPSVLLHEITAKDNASSGMPAACNFNFII